MKKKFLLIPSLVFSSYLFSQVGINNAAPKATLDITAQSPSGTATTVEGLIVPRVDRQRAQSMTSIPTSTIIYVNDISTGTLTGTAVNIDAVGLYTYNGTVWAKVNSGGNNIYNADGALTGNRTVNMGNNNLSYTGTGNIGIGTTPSSTAKLDINGKIQIRGGNPGAGKILVSDDVGGLASWVNIPSTWFAILKEGYLPKLTAVGTERIINFNSGIISNPLLGGYNTTNETISVPYAGNYRVTISGWWGNPIVSGDFLAIVHLKINNVALWRPHALGSNAAAIGSGSGVCVSFTTVVQLNAGDTLTVYNQDNSSTYASEVGMLSPSGAGTYYPAQLVVEFMGS